MSSVFAATLLACFGCSALDELKDDDDDSTYFLQASIAGGSSGVIASNGQSFAMMSSAFVSPTATYVSIAKDGDCWLSIMMPASIGSATLITTGGSTGSAPSIYYQCTGDGYPDAPLSGTATLVSRSVTPGSGSASFTINLTGAYAVASGAGPNLNFSGNISVNFTDASGIPGAPAGSASFTCPGGSQGVWQCLTNAGQTVPGRYDNPVLHGTWVEPSFQVCMTLNSNGTSSFRYKSGFGPTNGMWGAIVNKSGQFQPTSGPYYVFTGSTDAQIKLLSFDASQSKFVGWGFAKGTCSW